MTWKINRCTLLAGVALLFFTGQAQAVTLPFLDNFDAENGGNESLNYTGFANWDVVDGTVDLIGNGGTFDVLPGNGLYVDLDGSTPNDAGLLISKFTLGPGTYVMSFKIAGSQRGFDTGGHSNATDTVRVKVGNTALLTQTLPFNVPFLPTSFGFSLSSPGKVSFENIYNDIKGDNVGILLDDISIVAVPEPASLLLLGAGLTALGFRRRR